MTDETGNQASIQELKQELADKDIMIVGLKLKISQLQHKLDNFEIYQRDKCCECEKDSVVKYCDIEFKNREIVEKIRKIIDEYSVEEEEI